MNCAAARPRRTHWNNRDHTAAPLPVSAPDPHYTPRAPPNTHREPPRAPSCPLETRTRIGRWCGPLRLQAEPHLGCDLLCDCERHRSGDPLLARHPAQPVIEAALVMSLTSITLVPNAALLGRVELSLRMAAERTVQADMIDGDKAAKPVPKDAESRSEAAANLARSVTRTLRASESMAKASACLGMGKTLCPYACMGYPSSAKTKVWPPDPCDTRILVRALAPLKREDLEAPAARRTGRLRDEPVYHVHVGFQHVLRLPTGAAAHCHVVVTVP